MGSCLCKIVFYFTSDHRKITLSPSEIYKNKLEYDMTSALSEAFLTTIYVWLTYSKCIGVIENQVYFALEISNKDVTECNNVCK